MVEAAWRGLLRLGQEELLQPQLHLGAGNGTLFALLLMAQDHQLLLQPLPLQLLLLLLFPLPLLLQVSLPLGCQSLLLLLLQVFLQLCLVLPSQVCMLLLELGEQKLLLQLLLLLQGCQLLLQLPLPHHGVCGVHRLHSPGRQPPPHPRAHGTGHGPRQCRLHLCHRDAVQ